jgi:N-acetylglutamate synthase-like GNAT family acetyltransferase/thioredoxin reductase
MLNNTVSLRQAAPSDWPAIAALLTANKLPLEGARDHLGTYLVALSNGEIVGCAGAEVYGEVALLRSVSVAPGLHQQGVGKLMVGRLLDEARRRQVARIYLLTVTAPEYFAQFGFKRSAMDTAPQALKSSAEFQGACPACAALMSLTLNATPAPQLDLPVAVLGAGPVGLSAAAKLLERGMTPLVLEAGAEVGAHLAAYGHVRLFSPWRYNVDPAMAGLLAPSGWEAPAPEELPTAGEIVERVLKPFARLPQMARVLHTGTRVVSVSREGFDKVKTFGRDKAAFVINALRDGVPVQFKARAVIDATGTWSTPNPVGANGLPALGEHAAADRIFYGIPDVLGRHRERYAGKRVLVVGAGHSAANALLALAALAKDVPATHLAWAVRSATLRRVFGGGAADALPARGRLGASLKALRDAGGLAFVSGLRITEIRRVGHKLQVLGLDAAGQAVALADVDEIVCATGQRPDLGLTSELRLKLDPWLESTEALGPLIDPNLHSCGTVRPHGHRELAHPEPGFYTIGVKSYGRAPTFLMATGFEQARSVVAALDNDLAAADRVELDLPQTGVCSSDDDPASGMPEAAGCCGPALVPAVAPADAPARPAAGCGPTSCGAATPAPQPAAARRCCG